MRKRLADIGGKLEWTSEPERGTAVRMTVPLGEQKKFGI
jgi:signal transduction histidine kinase